MAVKPVAPPAKTPSASAGHPVSDPSSVDSHDHSAGTPSPHSRDEARKRQPVAVQLQNVSLAFRGVAVLEDVTLDIRRGDFLAVLGPNGAGKSTLLKLIGGLLKPDQGAVTVFGQAAHLLGRGRARLGVMPQAGSVNESFPVTAAQVVMMGRFSQMGPGRFPRRGDREAVALALERSGAQNLALRPLGKLSGGQRQRVFLARALVNNPELLLLDEPTAGMDTQGVEQFYGLLQQLNSRGVAIVIVSHDVGVVSTYVDRVACLNRRLVAHGRPEVVMDEEVLEEMYGCHTMFFAHGQSPHMVVRKHTP